MAQPKTETSPMLRCDVCITTAPVTWKLLLDVPKNAKPGDYPISGSTRLSGVRVRARQQHLRAAARRALLRHAQSWRPDEPTPRRRSRSRRATATGKSPKLPPSSQIISTANQPIRRQLHPLQQLDPTQRRPNFAATDQYELKRVVLDTSNSGSLSYYIALAFVGGLILNLMPCVLPVIGLKVMSFVEQVGQKPRPRARAEPLVRRRNRLRISIARPLGRNPRSLAGVPNSAAQRSTSPLPRSSSPWR